MNIQQAVKLAKLATNKSMPMYENIAITENGEKLIAVNGSMRIAVDVDGMAGIECAVDASKLVAAVSKFKAPEFSHSDGKMTIKEGRSRIAIPSISVDELPLSMEAGESVPAQAGLIGALQLVSFAAGVDDVRQYLNGVYLTQYKGMAAAVATNGHVMAYTDTGSTCNFKSTIIPIGAISTIAAVNPSRISIGEKSVFSGDGVDLTVKPIDGKFPDWERVIPANPHVLKVDRAALLDALGKVSIVSNDKMQAGILSISPDAITISTRHTDSSEAQAMVECEASAEVEIGVNIRYLIDAATAISDESLTIEYGEPGKALHFVGSNVCVVVMPMRI